MARLTALLCLAGVVVACDMGHSPRLPRPTFVQPPPPATPDPPPTPIPATPISLGQEVQGRFVGSNLHYELTASSRGTLVARLTWDPFLTGAFLILTIGSTEFRPAEPTFSPIVGRIPAVAGETYRLTISRGGTDHDYNVPFVLTISLER